MSRRAIAGRTAPLASRGRGGLLTALFIIANVALLAGACSSKTVETTPNRCPPGRLVYCRCADMSEGSKTCNASGTGFDEPCNPCSADNPEVEESDEPFPGLLDAGDGSVEEPADTCGDGVVQDGEDCDDGNGDEEDGCDASCRLAGVDPASSRTCPGLDVHVWSAPVTWTSTTDGSPNTATASPACAGGGTTTTGSTAPDRVLRVTAHRSGTMTVATTGASFNCFLHAARECVSGTNTTIACANNRAAIGDETMTLPVESGATYTVFIDGAGISQQQGAFGVSLSIR